MKYAEPVWAHTWDNRKSGYVSDTTLHRLQERVGLLGPVAGIMGRRLEAELQAYPYQEMLKDDMIEKSSQEVEGIKAPFRAEDIKEDFEQACMEDYAKSWEDAKMWEDYSSHDEDGNYAYHHSDPDKPKRRLDPDRRQQDRHRGRAHYTEVPDPRPGVYTDRRQRDRSIEDRSPLRRNKGRGK